MQLQTCNWVSEWASVCSAINLNSSQNYSEFQENTWRSTEAAVASSSPQHSSVSVAIKCLRINSIRINCVSLCKSSSVPAGHSVKRILFGQLVIVSEWVRNDEIKWDCHCPAKSTRQSGATSNLLPAPFHALHDSLCHWFQFLAIYAYYANNQSLLFLLTKFNPPGIGFGGGVSSPICNKFSISERKFTPAVAFCVILLSFSVVCCCSTPHLFYIHNTQHSDCLSDNNSFVFLRANHPSTQSVSQMKEGRSDEGVNTKWARFSHRISW